MDPTQDDGMYPEAPTRPEGRYDNIGGPTTGGMVENHRWANKEHERRNAGLNQEKQQEAEATRSTAEIDKDVAEKRTATAVALEEADRGQTHEPEQGKAPSTTDAPRDLRGALEQHEAREQEVAGSTREALERHEENVRQSSTPALDQNTGRDATNARAQLEQHEQPYERSDKNLEAQRDAGDAHEVAVARRETQERKPDIDRDF